MSTLASPQPEVKQTDSIIHATVMKVLSKTRTYADVKEIDAESIRKLLGHDDPVILDAIKELNRFLMDDDGGHGKYMLCVFGESFYDRIVGPLYTIRNRIKLAVERDLYVEDIFEENDYCHATLWERIDLTHYKLKRSGRISYGNDLAYDISAKSDHLDANFDSDSETLSISFL